jgi:hypothetical protein
LLILERASVQALAGRVFGDVFISYRSIGVVHHCGQAASAGEGLGVVGAEDAGLLGDELAVEAGRLGPVTGLPGRPGMEASDDKGKGVVGAMDAELLGDELAVEADRLCPVTILAGRPGEKASVGERVWVLGAGARRGGCS